MARRFALTNSGNSCFIDALLVAMFFPRSNHYFFFKMLDVDDDDGQGAQWETRATLRWRRSLQNELKHQAAKIHTLEPVAWTCTALRMLLQQVPYSTFNPGTGEEVAVNFGFGQQQSSVDFLRYLLAVTQLRDSISSFQTSTTFFQRRPEVEAVGTDIDALASLWFTSKVVNKWTAANAADLEDESERRVLERDASGKAMVVENVHKDRRRIAAPETASVFLCQMTMADRGTHAVRIERELLPHAETVGGEGYTGSVCAKITATRLLSSPMLIFDVARKVVFYDEQSQQQMQTKVVTPVEYGTSEGEDYFLSVCGTCFVLTAVVCHVGSSVAGHYVCFVRSETDGWHFYDDVHGCVSPIEGTLEEQDSLKPSSCGELFFYSPLRYEKEMKK
jgi:uncharacterized UBP type Zn finger protein